MNLRPYQQRAVDLCREMILSPDRDRLLLSAPTGTGKGVIQQAVAALDPDTVIMSPSKEILRSYGERRGLQQRDLEANGLYTPTAYRNRLMAGLEPAKVILHDEAHHATEATSVVTQELLAIAPLSKHIGFTATPYRATPRGSAALVELWGRPVILLTIDDAVREGYWQMPALAIEPLLDDDILECINGEFSIKSANEATGSRLESLIDAISRHRNGPTMVALPSTEMVHLAAKMLGNQAATIIQDTTEAERVAAYAACRAGDKILLQIKAVSEGVDLPWLQTLIDARPLLSPVAWMQTFGRLTRPWAAEKTYICTNRNLERFAYLLDGLAPMMKVKESQQAFGGPCARAAGRQIGLEAVGKFKAIPVPLASGVQAAMYCLQSLGEDRRLTEFLILCLPAKPHPVVFSRQNGAAEWVDGLPQRTWGKWKLERGLPDDFVGYKTSPHSHKLSDKQRAFWERSAEGRGLLKDAGAKLQSRQFAILPALLDTRLSLAGVS